MNVARLLANIFLLVVVARPVWAGDFEFVVIGDTRPRFQSESFRPFQHLIGKINALKPALVINLGDLIYGYGTRSKARQWDDYQSVIKSIAEPYFQVPGNHDTHSKAARRVYGRRFGKFYQSLDYEDCHFVLLDSTEKQKWGYISPAELAWLEQDLNETRARSVFVFLHFPVWEPERITPESYEVWARTLHPLFKTHRVKAVFAGHYHAYGPTREFDGIRYFITGGGGAELRPEYRKSGGEYHFMRVKVSADHFDVRVVTDHGELTDSEADVMGGLQFAARNVSRIGIPAGGQNLRAGIMFDVSVSNPYGGPLTGKATWLMDASAFSVQPPEVDLAVPVAGTRRYTFTLRALQDSAILESLPRLEFSVSAAGHIHRFHRELRFLEELTAPFRAHGPLPGTGLAVWNGLPRLALGSGAAQAELAAYSDAQSLFLALKVPAPDREEAEELGFSDEVQLGVTRRLGRTDFGGDLLRLGINSNSRDVRDRTPGHRTDSIIREVKATCQTSGRQKVYQVAIPLNLLRNLKLLPGNRMILDLAFPAPSDQPETNEPPNPPANTFSYRIRYGSDSLVPVHFVQLNLENGR